MRSLRRIRTRADRRRRRHMRVRRKVDGTPERPRLVVYRSLKHIYAQLVDDTLGRTLTAASDRSATVEPEGAGKVGKARGVGKMLADRAQELGIKRVVFDRGGYPYHGRVKALAEGARKGGLEF